MESAIGTLLAGQGLRLVRELSLAFGVKAYVVGGCLRDLLLGRKGNDVDIALAGAWRELPSMFAERSGGTFFWLDEERGHSRVVIRNAAQHATVDFAPLRGESIAEDLALRDFTINALAVPLTEEDRLIDPFGGLEDIRQKLIRTSAPTAFRDDPLRLVRAFRFATVLGFRIEEATLSLVPGHAPLLSQIAGERIRDEFFQILQAPDAAGSMRKMAETGLLPRILPHRAGEETFAAVAQVEKLCEAPETLTGEHRCDHLVARLQEEMQSGITVSVLLKLAAFLFPSGISHHEAGKRLKLGNAAQKLLGAYCRIGSPALRGRRHELSPGAMYRFFNGHEPAGIELPLLGLALRLTAKNESRELTEYYLTTYLPRTRELILSGDDIMALLGIPQGQLVGKAVSLLREAQATGLVQTHDEAAAYLRKKLLTTDEPLR